MDGVRYWRDGEYLCAANLTARRHNTLHLRLADAAHAPSEPAVDCLPPAGPCGHAPLDATQVRRFVLEGVDTANRTLGTRYAVSQLRYFEDDMPPEVVYGMLALLILQRWHGGGYA
jgi:hypothetical protein